MAETSSISTKTDKPVFVRVKRKASQSCLDAFWLEINERPLKRPLLDFSKLSISDSSTTTAEELKSKKVFVRHVDTVSSSVVTFDVLQSYVPSSVNSVEESGSKNKEMRRTFKTEDKQDQLLTKAKQSQETLSRNARFEQIWRSRKEKKETKHDEALHDMCRLYDVIRVDEEKKRDLVEMDNDDEKMMSQFLPLLKEVLPSAADEIEGVLSDSYVYDIYAVKDDDIDDVAYSFPSVHVDDDDDDDDFYDGPDESEHESYDSNAEDNPMNEYPDEESSDSEDEEEEEDDEDEEDEEEEGLESEGNFWDEGESEVKKKSNNNNGGFSEDEDYVDDDGEGYGNEYDYGDNSSGEEEGW